MTRRNSDGADGQRRRQARRGSQTATPKKRKGVCWGQPVLTTADHVDSNDDHQDVERFDVLCGANLDDDPTLNSKMRESNRSKRLRAAVPFSKTDASPVGMGGVGDGQQGQAANAESSRAAAKKLKRAEAAAGKIRMSTSVPALAELPSEGGAAGNKQGLGSECLAAAPALVDLPQAMRQYMAAQSFSEPTVLQAKAWEAAEERVDVLAQAPPGSGKTLAYLLPIASLLLERGHGRNTRPPSPLGLIIAPTHELAQQIHRAAVPLQQLFGLRCICVHGGASREEQLLKVQQQPHILVVTPGRMLSLGFAPELLRLRTMLLEPPSGSAAAGSGAAAAAPTATQSSQDNPTQDTTAPLPKQGKKQRKKPKGDMQLLPCMPVEPFKRPQVLMVSATMPNSALLVAEGWLSPNAKRVHVSHAGSDLISSSIIQVVHVCAQHKKPTKLLKHLHGVNAEHASARHAPRVLVFANTTKTVNTLSAALSEANFKCASLHGKRTHEERAAALHAFKAGKVQVLVATDVAARGLHIPRLPYIVNYDFPSNLETYVHRVGRTGRLEANGHAFSFITRNLAPLAHDLVDLLTSCEQAVDPNLLKLKEAYAIIQQKLQQSSSQKPGPRTAHFDDTAGKPCVSAEAHEDAAAPRPAQATPSKNAKKTATVRKRACGSTPVESGHGYVRGYGCENDKAGQGKGLDTSVKAGKKKRNSVQQGSVSKVQDIRGNQDKKKKRRSREDKRAAAAGLDTGKKAKQGILGPPRTELARLEYYSGDDSD